MTDDLVKVIEENPLAKGVTFSGGEPFSQAEAFAELAGKLKTRARRLSLQQPILSAQQQESSLLSGRTVQVWRSSADRREQILHLLSMMRWLQPKQEMQTYFSVIQQDVFILMRI